MRLIEPIPAALVISFSSRLDQVGPLVLSYHHSALQQQGVREEGCSHARAALLPQLSQTLPSHTPWHFASGTPQPLTDNPRMRSSGSTRGRPTRVSARRTTRSFGSGIRTAVRMHPKRPTTWRSFLRQRGLCIDPHRRAPNRVRPGEPAFWRWQHWHLWHAPRPAKHLSADSGRHAEAGGRRGSGVAADCRGRDGVGGQIVAARADRVAGDLSAISQLLHAHGGQADNALQSARKCHRTPLRGPEDAGGTPE
eukprot:scaffold33_cov135-Pinguiococcus_pyrenoidosus.AAC.11